VTEKWTPSEASSNKAEQTARERDPAFADLHGLGDPATDPGVAGDPALPPPPDDWLIRDFLQVRALAQHINVTARLDAFAAAHDAATAEAPDGGGVRVRWGTNDDDLDGSLVSPGERGWAPGFPPSAVPEPNVPERLRGQPGQNISADANSARSASAPQDSLHAGQLSLANSTGSGAANAASGIQLVSTSPTPTTTDPALGAPLVASPTPTSPAVVNPPPSGHIQVAAGDCQGLGGAGGCQNGGSWGTSAMYLHSGRELCHHCAVKALGIQDEPAAEKVRTLTPFLLPGN
jgi:hypothetical protein